MKQFNINDYVRVKLTKLGISILKNQYDEIKKTYPLAQIGDFKLPEIDENGFVEFPLWKLMSCFGPYITFGEDNLPFETIIIIPEENLKDFEKDIKIKKL